MSSDFKPMLAGKPANDAGIRFPVLASPKIDGVRAANVRGDLLSRSLKLIPNKYTQAVLGIRELHGLDGELTVGDPTHANVMQNTTSGVMSLDKIPAFTYHVFDYWDDDLAGFSERLRRAQFKVDDLRANWVKIATANKIEAITSMPLAAECPIHLVEHQIIHNLDELNAYEAEMLDEGWEGVMIRDPNGRYKYGRSTAKEAGLLKIKRFNDAEAIIIGFEEEQFNGNEATTNELGRTKRSSHKAGKTGKDTLGAFIVRDVETGIEFNIGTGLTDELAKIVWQDRAGWMNKVVKYKYFAHGVKEAPRHPVYVGVRDPRDMA